MREKVIPLFGLGGIGSSSALELAKAGVAELRLVDGDIVEPGTVVRWGLGLSAAGIRKVDALEIYLSKNYPHTAVRAFPRKIGTVRMPGDEETPEQDLLEEILDRASLIYDATAELGVQYFLADLARQKGITYLGVQATGGGMGGWVLRIRPDETEGCWVCLQKWWDDQSRLSESGWNLPIPMPPGTDSGARVQPTGCADPTFTASGFDLLEVATMGVRWAVGTLSGSEPGGYPDHEFDLAVLRIRGDDGSAILPEWKGVKLPRHPDCPACSASRLETG